MNDLVPTKPNQLVAYEADLKIAHTLAASGMFKDSKQMAQAYAKMLMGRELGLSPSVAISSVYFLQGKLALGANAMGVVVRKSPDHGWRVKKPQADNFNNNRCVLEFLHRGEVVGESEFTMADAKLAGLAFGDNWKKYPKNMLFARAMSNGCKWFVPECFSGSAPYTPDELGAHVTYDASGDIVEVTAEEKEPAVDPARFDLLRQLIEETGADEKKITDNYSVASLEGMSSSCVEAAIKILNQRKVTSQEPMNV